MSAPPLGASPLPARTLYPNPHIPASRGGEETGIFEGPSDADVAAESAFPPAPYDDPARTSGPAFGAGDTREPGPPIPRNATPEPPGGLANSRGLRRRRETIRRRIVDHLKAIGGRGAALAEIQGYAAADLHRDAVARLLFDLVRQGTLEAEWAESPSAPGGRAFVYRLAAGGR